MAKLIDTLIQDLIMAAGDARIARPNEATVGKRLTDAKNAIKSQFREAGDKIASLRNSLNAAEGKIRELTLTGGRLAAYSAFDAETVKPGDEIEVRDVAGFGSNVWRKATFLTLTSRGHVLSESSDSVAASQHEQQNVRVPVKTQELQLFVNVMRNPAPMSAKAYAYLSADEALRAFETGGHNMLIAIAQPVTVTVAP